METSNLIQTENADQTTTFNRQMVENLPNPGGDITYIAQTAPGVVMNTTTLGRALVEPEFEPVFAELDRRATALFLHPAGNSALSPLIADHQLTWMVGAPVEDTISIMQLITHGIPARYPDIKIINSHLGGALPMLLQRADDQYSWEAPDTPEPPSVAARRMW